MADLNPLVPQINDAELEADLSRLLTVVGPLGRLNVLDTVIPVVILGQTGDVPEVQPRGPVFQADDVFTTGVQTAPLATLVIADTGALPRGNYDIKIVMFDTDATRNVVDVQHRNAANAADIIAWSILTLNRVTVFSYAQDFAQDERLRLRVLSNASAGSTYSGVIFAQIRF